MRTLANRTASSSAEITEVINNIQQQTEKAYLMMQRNLKTVESGMEDSDNTRQILFKVEEAIDHLADMVQQVADATGQLSHTLSHTSDKVSGISLQAQTGEQEAQECLQLASSPASGQPAATAPAIAISVRPTRGYVPAFSRRTNLALGPQGPAC